MTRLPDPGSDDGTWGDILNAFLLVEHNADGTLKASGSLAAKANDSSVVHLSGNEVIAGTKTFSNSPVVPTPSLGSQAANKQYVDTTAAAGAPDASTSTKGLVQLGGDLAGTGTAAAAPIITDGAITNSKLANGAVSTNKLAAGAVTTNEIADATITNTDISASAAIARTKLDSSTQTSLGKADTALQSAPVTSVAGKTGVVTLAESDITSLTSDLAATEKSANKGVASGYAPLNGSSIVPTGNLGSGTASSSTYLRGDGTWVVPPSAPVTSVNTHTGVVVLNPDDLDDTSTTHKFVTASDITKLGNTSGTNTGDQDLSGLVPKTTTVNGHALSSNITVTASDVGLGSVTNNAQLKIASNLSDLASASTARTNLGLGTASTISATAGGDLSGTLPSPTVVAINGTSLASLTTGVLKNTTGTGVPSIATAADIPTVAAGGSGPLGASQAIPESQITNLTTDLASKQVSLTITAVKTSAYTAAANEFVPVDTTSGSVIITLPATPVDGTIVGAKMVIQGSTNTVSIATGGSDVFNKTGGSTSVTLTYLNQGVNFRYKASVGIWYGMAADLGLTALDVRYTQRANNLSDLASASSARTNLGLGALATLSSIDLTANVGATILPIANGGTGSGTQNFVDLSSTQSSIAGAKTFTGNATFSSGVLTLSNATSNYITWGGNGIAAPTFTTRSAGTKVVLYNSLTGSAADYAMGIASNVFWSSIAVATSANKFAWYGGTTAIATLDGTGSLVLAGSVTAGGSIVKRVVALTDAATVTPNAGTTDIGKLLTLSQSTTIANPSGTPIAGQQLTLRIKSTSSQTLTWGSQYRGSTDISLPGSTTGSSLTDYMQFLYNADDTKWDLIGLVRGF